MDHVILFQGVPAAATIDELPNEVTGDTITLKWSQPQNNGRLITQYTIYQRKVTDGKPREWNELKTITDVSVRALTVDLESCKVYEFLVTATNEFGESLKENGKIMRVKASGGMCTVYIFTGLMKFRLLYCYDYSTVKYVNTMKEFYPSRYHD